MDFLLLAKWGRFISSMLSKFIPNKTGLITSEMQESAFLKLPFWVVSKRMVSFVFGFLSTLSTPLYLIGEQGLLAGLLTNELLVN